MPANLENLAMATGLKKVSFLSNCKKKINAKEASRILQARLQQYMNQELPDMQTDLERQRN